MITTQVLKPLQSQLEDVSILGDDGSTNPADAQLAQQLKQQVAFKQQRLAAVQQELDGRDAIIADARQRRDATAQDRINTQTSLAVLHTVRATGGMEALQSDLSTMAQGGALPENRAKLLNTLGLLSNEDDGTGGASLKVTPTGQSLLPSDVQKAISTSPDKFAVTDDDIDVQPQHAAAAQTLAGLVNPGGTGAKPKASPAPTGTMSPLAFSNGKRLAPEQAQRQWQYAQSSILGANPQIGVAGSPANVAFVRAFRATGGDARKALQAARASVALP